MTLIGMRQFPARLQHAFVGLAIVMALGMIFCGAVFADSYTLRDGQGNAVRITDDPCPNATGWLSKALKKAHVRFNGQDFEACWMEVGGAVVVVDSNGDQYPLPPQGFTKDISS